MIDLGALKSVVERFIQDSLNDFAVTHPDVRASCLGIFCQSYYGSLSVFVDTADHAQAKLREQDKWLANQKNDQVTMELMGENRFRHWIQIMEARGRDSMGRFETGCNDFAHGAGELSFPNWPKPHTESEDEVGRWEFLWPDGRITQADMNEGDAGIDREAFPFLVECLESLDTSRLITDGLFRLGVEMHDETFAKFWIPKELQSDGYRAYEYCYTQLGF